jgi:hypothetical protein
LFVDIEGLSASILADLLLLGGKVHSKATLTNITTTITFGLDFEKSRTHSIAGYRSSNKKMIYFMGANDNRQRNINLLILLVLLLAKTYNELTHRDDFMHISLIGIVM